MKKVTILSGLFLFSAGFLTLALAEAPPQPQAGVAGTARGGGRGGARGGARGGVPATASSAPAPYAPMARLPALPAFPGAEGFGANTVGGRGGEVYEVTNLDDAGPGSLRDAVSKSHRTVIFRVSGTIDLKSALPIRQPFITVAGQTAPGDGICTRYFPFGAQSHDIIIRFIRGRLGDLHGEGDSLDIWNGARDDILDHCSATWSVDEALSTAGDNRNITVQWCLIGESLNKSVHAKGPHGFGSLARANGDVSWYHNLWAHNNSRNPRLGDFYGRGASPFFDVRNNVMYDYGGTASGLTQGTFHANYVGNYLRPGPSSTAKAPIHIGEKSDITFYLDGNIWEDHPDDTKDNSKFIDGYQIKGVPEARTSPNPFPSPVVASFTAQQAFDACLPCVGAILPHRDAADAHIIATVRDHSGKLIDSQNDVGGWPELKSAPAPLDSDHDGIPDEWETAHGLNPHDASDANADPDNDGYTNLEEYLNGTDPQQFVDYRDPKNNVDPLNPLPPRPAK